MRPLIRSFKESDFDAICLLEQGGKGSPYSSAVFIRQATIIFSPWFSVAEGEGDVLGYGIGALNQQNQDEGWILRLRVGERWQGQGIGRLLLDGLVRSLNDAGAARILLSVSPDNYRALQLYQNYGFSEVDFISRYFGTGEDRLIMQLKSVWKQDKSNINPFSRRGREQEGSLQG